MISRKDTTDMPTLDPTLRERLNSPVPSARCSGARVAKVTASEIITIRRSAAKESVVERDLTDATAADSARDGRTHRRSFTSEEKLAIVLECE